MPIVPQKLTWQADFSVQVKELDEQHQRLINLINDLIDCLNSSSANDKYVKDLVKDLKVDEAQHFATEEKYFVKFSYPEAELHTAKHRQFLEACEKIEKLYTQDTLLYVTNLIYFLEEWWINHILGDDKKYSHFFNEHGLK